MPIEMEIEEDGKSKGCVVMTQIEVLPHTKVG